VQVNTENTKQLTCSEIRMKSLQKKWYGILGKCEKFEKKKSYNQDCKTNKLNAD